MIPLDFQPAKLSFHTDSIGPRLDKARPHDEPDYCSSKLLLQQRSAQLAEDGRGSNHRKETVNKLAHQAG